MTIFNLTFIFFILALIELDSSYFHLYFLYFFYEFDFLDMQLIRNAINFLVLFEKLH